MKLMPAEIKVILKIFRDIFPLKLHSKGKSWTRFILAEWAPTGNAVILVHENDIYYKPNPRTNLTYRVTQDGVPGQIYNGVPDWLYEGDLVCIIFNI